MIPLNINDLVLRLGIMGNDKKCHCPNSSKHTNSDKNSSFSVFDSDRKYGISFKCHRCKISGNLIKLIMVVKGCDVSDAFKWLEINFPVFYSSLPKNTQTSNSEIVNFDNGNSIEITNSDIYGYFNEYGITNEVFVINRVYSVLKLHLNKRIFVGNVKHPIFAYKVDENCYKIYQPKSENFKFRHLGIKTKQLIFGLKNCKKDLNYVILTGGEKDVLTLQSMGFNAITFNSETSLDVELIEKVKSLFSLVLVLYDNDQTGFENCEHLCENYNFYNLNVQFGIIPKHIKDISDFVALSTNQNSEDIKQQIETKISFYKKRYSNIRFLTDRFHEKLPSYFKMFLDMFETGEEKELMLVCLIVLCSSLFNNVESVYDSSRLYPNLFAFITGRAASGKGRMKYVVKLIEEYFNLEKDEKKPHKRFIISANNTKTGLMLNLRENKGRGLIFDTEADTLAASNKSEHGDFSELIRKGYHNEYIDNNRVDESKVFNIPCPKFGLLISGTAMQRVKIIPNVEDGLLSRFIFWSTNSDTKFKDVYENEISLDELVKTQSIKLESYLNQLYSFSLITCEVDKEVKKSFTFHFKEIEKFKITEDGHSSILNRMASTCHKIIVIFSVMRHLCKEKLSDKIVVNMEDYLIAKDITDVLLENSLLYFNSFEVYDNKMKLLRILPKTFKASDFKKYSNEMTCSEKTIKRYVEQLIKENKIIKEQRGLYVKK